MSQTLYLNKSYKKILKEHLITILMLWGAAIAVIILAKNNQAHYVVSYVMFFVSLFLIAEILIYRNAVFQIDVNGNSCTFISRNHSISIKIADIESLLTCPDQFLLLRFRHTTGFILINGYLLPDVAPGRRKLYIKWNKIFRNKQLEHEKLLEPFIQYVCEHNKKFQTIFKTENECELS